MNADEKILIADDEADIRGLLRLVLEKEGYTILEAANGAMAWDIAKSNPDLALCVLDIMMPEMSGLEAGTAIRKISDAPILFLTALSSDADKIKAYGCGADDYIVKPFYATDLRLKVRALIGRYRNNTGRAEEKCGVTVDEETRTVCRCGETVLLTEKEYGLLLALWHRRGDTLTTAELYETVWQDKYLPGDANAVMVHIANLRKKLEENPVHPKLILTVWGKGYRIE